MNIFVLCRNPVHAAQDHCDRHVVKMIIESAQMLSFAHHAVGSKIQNMYANSRGHMQHPCTLWVRESSANYLWLYELAMALSAEYTDRYGRVHKTEREVLRHLWRVPPGYANTFLTPHAQCMPEHLRRADPVEAYRDLYVTKLFTHKGYRHSPTPLWLLERLGEA